MSTKQINVSQYGAQKYNINGQVDAETARTYWTVLLATAAADGELAPAELEWLVNEQRSIGVPEEMLAEIPKVQWRGANVEELLGKIKYSFAVNTRRTMLYQAIRMSRADRSYHQTERAAIDRIARTLDIDSAVVDSIHALVEMEEAVDRLRHGLLETSRNT